MVRTMTAECKTRVMIIDDYPTVAADLRTMLELVEGVEVVGQCASNLSTLNLAEGTQPDVVILDLDVDRRKSPLSEGQAVVSKISGQWPGAAIYLLSTAETRSDLPAGITAAFVKGNDTERLLDCIRNFTSQSERKVEMEATRERTLKVAEQAKAVVLPQVKARTRLAYIDTLRMVLIILVIMVHAAVTYGSIGDWTYEDPMQDETSAIILSFFVIDCQAFFMGLMFFFAGYFTPGAYDRKGIVKFWQDRLLRLALPMVLYTWVLSKVPNYINATANEGMRISFGEFFVQNFWTWADKGPTWFLFALLIFSLGYTLWRVATRKANLAEKLSNLPTPKTGTLLAAALAIGISLFVIIQWLPLGESYTVVGPFDMQLEFFPGYILLFVAGALAYRSNWMEKLSAKSLPFWGWTSLGLIISLPIFFFLGGAVDGKLDYFMSGMHWQSAGTSLWLGLGAVAFSMALTLWLRGRVTANDKLAAFAGPNNFAVYLIHPLVLVPVTWYLSRFEMMGLAKFAIASVVTTVLCYAIATILRRIPGVNKVL